jgi:nitroimidazol reductase NimA-like FMN-containing flavoprotein (pyridoxamine 5'-phosphate oxidase superfamily)
MPEALGGTKVKMRRSDREINSIEGKLSIIKQCTVCRLALCGDGMPYIIPLNYGYSYEDGSLSLYFHSAHVGKKIDMIQKNNRACFEIDCAHKLLEGERACDYSYAYKSVIGFGAITFLETKEEKAAGLQHLMRQQTGKDDVHQFSDAMLNRVCVYKMCVDEWTGKEHV